MKFSLNAVGGIEMLTQRDKNMLRYLEDHGAFTIYQCYQMFFKHSRYGFDLARKRLKKLEELKFIKHYTNTATKEYVYYLDKRLSAHELYVMSVYSTLIYEGAEIIKFQKESRFLNGDIRADALIEYSFNGYIDDIIVEVDLTHSPDISEYERLYDAGELQKQCGGEFPILLIVSDKDKKYISNKINIVQINTKLDQFKEKVLAG